MQRSAGSKAWLEGRKNMHGNYLIGQEVAQLVRGISVNTHKQKLRRTRKPLVLH